MRMFGALVRGVLVSGALVISQFTPVHAVEEGQLLKRGAGWEYVTSEDPGLKYLLQKGIISQGEYDTGAKVIAEKERATKLKFDVGVNNGLNFRVGDKFLLKVRLLTQVRFTRHQYNEAWATIGDNKNAPELLGGQVEFRGVRKEDDTTTFQVRRTRLQFLGYLFDPDFRYNIAFSADQNELSPDQGGKAQLLDAYISSWHFPYATVQLGQQRVWFNRAHITSAATRSFSDQMFSQRMFSANALNGRDIGLAILSDENKYRFNYAIGVFNGMGPGLTNEGSAVSQLVPGLQPNEPGRTFNFNQRVKNGDLMYVARLLWNISGNPGYGEGDLQYSRKPQVAIGFGYAYNPGLNTLRSIRSDIVARGSRSMLVGAGNGRLLGGGIWDLQTYELDVTYKYHGWAFQAEGYYRHQRQRDGGDAGTIPFATNTAEDITSPEIGQAWGWYAQLGKFIIPRKLEVAVRYGITDPSTEQVNDLIKELGVALNYSFDGTYNNRVIAEYSNITMGTGGAAPDRAPFDRLTGAGRDLVENRVAVQYQFFF